MTYLIPISNSTRTGISKKTVSTRLTQRIIKLTINGSLFQPPSRTLLHLSETLPLVAQLSVAKCVIGNQNFNADSAFDDLQWEKVGNGSGWWNRLEWGDASAQTTEPTYKKFHFWVHLCFNQSCAIQEKNVQFSFDSISFVKLQFN